MKYTYYMIIVSLLVMLAGCGNQEREASASIEQLHKENGVPVTVKELNAEEFNRSLSYNGKLKGAIQGTEESLLGGNIERIYFQEGDYVEKGEIILSFPEDLAGINYQAVKANYEVMSATLERLRKLEAEGGISRQDVDNAEAGYLAASSQLNAVEQMLKVKASVSGYLTAVYVHETDHVNSGDQLFTVSELDNLKAEIDVSEKEISLFRKGAKAVAYWENNEYAGKVESIGYAMNENSGAFEVALQFSNPEKIMKFNINAEIEVEVYHNPLAIVVEKKHLLHDSGGDYVYLAKTDRAEKRYVQTGEYSGISFEIVEGLQAGEELIVEGKDLLEDGSLIRINR